MLNIKTKLRRAFTIVELVVVIAVIAALAAILIPTFANVINAANESADTSLVKNLNTIFSSEQTITSSKPSTMSEALELAADNGYNIENLTPSSSGDIVWDQTSNRFLLIDEDGKIVYMDGTTADDVTSAKYQLWYIASSEESYTAAVEEGYSVYLNYTVETSAEAPLTVSAGVDVGDNEEVYISYTSTATQTVIFNTNGATLTINNLNADVYHYGTAQTVTITAVASSSYHLYGEVKGTLELKKGHLEIESSATISNINVTASNSSYVSITNSSSNSIEISGKSASIASNVASGVSGATAVAKDMDETLLSYFNGGIGTESNPFQISTSQQFSNIYYVSNKTSTYGYNSTDKVYYKLINDIELTTGYSSIQVTLFSGTYASSYGGRLYYAVLDGGGYTVTPSTVTAEDSTTTTYSNLFTQIEYCEIKNLEVNMPNTSKTIAFACSGVTTFTDVNVNGKISFPSGNYAAYIIYAYANITFNNCINYATINGLGGATGYDAIFIGYCQESGSYTYTFNNCRNEGSFTCGKAAMFVANLCGSNSYAKLVVNNCKNAGVIRATYTDYTPDYYIASGSVYNKGKCTVDGVSYTSASLTPTLNNVYQGPDDVATISLDDNGYFVITESNISGATTYVISIGLYTSLNGGGTTRFYVTITVSADQLADGSYTSILKNLKFMDLDTYVEATGDSELKNATAIGDSSYTVTVDGETYYLMNDEQSYLSNGTASATVFTLYVYDDDGNLLSSPSM